MTKQPPYPSQSQLRVSMSIRDGKLPNWPEAYAYPETNPATFELLQSICAKCWKYEPNNRPHMVDIITELVDDA